MRAFLHRVALLSFHIFFARPVLWWVAGLRYRRRRHVPDGPCLVVSNHNSHLDASLLLSLFPLRRLHDVHPIAAADYWQKSPIKKLFAMVFMNALPIERKPARGADPLAPLIDALNGGKSLIFFPEGSRGEAGVVAPFRAGIGRLVQRLPGLLVLPVYLSGPERIWPRGELLPVPIAVDAVVGRPRTYDSNLEPREIADRVREDVLALAPPPPPTPAPPPVPPLRIAVCGIDPPDRRALFEQLVQRLGPAGRTLGLSDSLLESDDEGVRELVDPVPFTRVSPWLWPLAWVFRTGGLFRGQRFGAMVEQALIDEALTRSRAAHLVTERSASIDLVAWVDADEDDEDVGESERARTFDYLAGDRSVGLLEGWRLCRRSPEVWLVHTFDLVHPPVPDMLVHVRTPVERAMRRRRAGGRALEPHENPAALERLQRGYERVGALLSRRRRVEFVEYDPDSDSQNAIVDSLVRSVARLREAERDRSGASGEPA